MGFSPGDFSAYTMGHWEDDIHWEASSTFIRLWNGDEKTLLLCLMDKAQAELALNQLRLLIDMTWPE